MRFSPLTVCVTIALLMVGCSGSSPVPGPTPVPTPFPTPTGVTVTLTVDGNSTSGFSATVNKVLPVVWSATNTDPQIPTPCTADGFDGNGSKPAAGNTTITFTELMKTVTLSISCKGAGGTTATATVVATVNTAVSTDGLVTMTFKSMTPGQGGTVSVGGSAQIVAHVKYTGSQLLTIMPGAVNDPSDNPGQPGRSVGEFPTGKNLQGPADQDVTFGTFNVLTSDKVPNVRFCGFYDTGLARGISSWCGVDLKTNWN
jgi:hypothetical protein